MLTALRTTQVRYITTVIKFNVVSSTVHTLYYTCSKSTLLGYFRNVTKLTLVHFNYITWHFELGTLFFFQITRLCERVHVHVYSPRGNLIQTLSVDTRPPRHSIAHGDTFRISYVILLCVCVLLITFFVVVLPPCVWVWMLILIVEIPVPTIVKLDIIFSCSPF